MIFGMIRSRCSVPRDYMSGDAATPVVIRVLMVTYIFQTLIFKLHWIPSWPMSSPFSMILPKLLFQLATPSQTSSLVSNLTMTVTKRNALLHGMACQANEILLPYHHKKREILVKSRGSSTNHILLLLTAIGLGYSEPCVWTLFTSCVHPVTHWAEVHARERADTCVAWHWYNQIFKHLSQQ